MFTVLGDVHGQKIPNIEGKVFQLGDLGFNYGSLDSLDSNIFKFGAGNHDNHALLKVDPPKHYVGRYGYHEWGFYWIGGAYSIDKKFRTLGFDWFANEELTLLEANACMTDYYKMKPDIVISHDCPTIIKGMIHENCIRTWTDILLNAILDIHSPKLWIFGHHHTSFEYKLGPTLFKGLNILEQYVI